MTARISAELEAPITVQRGKIQEYLGIPHDFTKQGKVMILMTDNIENMVDSLDHDMDNTSGIISV